MYARDAIFVFPFFYFNFYDYLCRKQFFHSTLTLKSKQSSRQ